jgi:hypothetical protein
MSAGIFNFVYLSEDEDYRQIQGDTWRFSFRYVATPAEGVTPAVYRDLTGLTPKMQIRKKPGGEVFLTFDVAAEPATGVTLGDQGDPDEVGLMTFYAASTDTGFKAADYYYDVQLSDGGTPPEVETFLSGTFTVMAQVTE